MNQEIIVSYIVDNENLISFPVSTFPALTRGDNIEITFRDPKNPRVIRCKVSSYKIQTDHSPDLIIHRVLILLKNLDKSAPKPKVPFDFEDLWNIYPRKQGKKDAETRFKNQIKSEDQYDMIRAAVIYYNEKCKLNSTEERFILLGSTFFGSRWMDYYEESLRAKVIEKEKQKEQFEFYKKED